jgi:hypothetical protein
MKNTKIAGDAGSETRVVILDSGEEAFATLTKFANETGITAASLTAIGAFEKATIGWFDFDKKTYKKIEVDQQCEVLSAIGDVAVGDDGKARRPFDGGNGPAHARGHPDRYPRSSAAKEESGYRNRAHRS